MDISEICPEKAQSEKERVLRKEPWKASEVKKMNEGRGKNLET